MGSSPTSACVQIRGSKDFDAKRPERVVSELSLKIHCTQAGVSEVPVASYEECFVKKLRRNHFEKSRALSLAVRYEDKHLRVNIRAEMLSGFAET